MEKTITVNAFRKSFCKYFPNRSTLTPQQISQLTSADVRTYTSSNSLPSQFQVANGFQVLVFVPENKTPTAKTKDGLPYAIGKVKNNNADVTVQVGGYDNLYLTTYYVWQIMSESTFSDTINFTWA